MSVLTQIRQDMNLVYYKYLDWKRKTISWIKRKIGPHGDPWPIGFLWVSPFLLIGIGTEVFALRIILGAIAIVGYTFYITSTWKWLKRSVPDDGKFTLLLLLYFLLALLAMAWDRGAAALVFSWAILVFLWRNAYEYEEQRILTPNIWLYRIIPPNQPPVAK